MSNTAGMQGCLPTERFGVNEATMRAPVSTCPGCSEARPLISCANCGGIICRRCCAACPSRGDNKA